MPANIAIAECAEVESLASREQRARIALKASVTPAPSSREDASGISLEKVSPHVFVKVNATPILF